MPSSFYQLVIHSRDPHALARFWSAVLDQPILFAADDEVIVGAHRNAYPGLCFVTVPEAKTIQNRLHIDLDPDDLEAEVARVLALGARHADVGQGNVPSGGARRPGRQRVLPTASAQVTDRLSGPRRVRGAARCPLR
jgi:glyoxalase superfamily protein